MKTVAIIEGLGANYASLQSALKVVGAQSFVSAEPSVITKADAVILPGVGTAQHAMKTLQDNQLVNTIPTLEQPVLGICLGHQLLCDFSEEGDVNCLGIIPLQVKKLSQPRISPHMGWNSIKVDQNILGLDQLISNLDFYFVHGYAAEINPTYTAATCDYGESFSAIIQKNNFYGVQFHPEKSGEAGLDLLKNFVSLS